MICSNTTTTKQQQHNGNEAAAAQQKQHYPVGRPSSSRLHCMVAMETGRRWPRRGLPVGTDTPTNRRPAGYRPCAFALRRSRVAIVVVPVSVATVVAIEMGRDGHREACLRSFLRCIGVGRSISDAVVTISSWPSRHPHLHCGFCCNREGGRQWPRGAELITRELHLWRCCCFCCAATAWLPLRCCCFIAVWQLVYCISMMC